jgi:hypothetical protein
MSHFIVRHRPSYPTRLSHIIRKFTRNGFCFALLTLCSGAMISAEPAVDLADPLRKLSAIELRAYQGLVLADDLQFLGAGTNDKRINVTFRANNVRAYLTTIFARRYLATLEILALQQMPAPAAKALVKSATIASPKGAVQPLAALDYSALVEAQVGAPAIASLELARWFIVIGRADLAGNLIATAAQDPDELTQIRAAELGADLLVSQRRYNYAVQGYEYAQTLLGRLHVDAQGYPRTVD